MGMRRCYQRDNQSVVEHWDDNKEIEEKMPVKMAQKKGYRATNPKQVFVGELTDNELGLIEDALEYCAGHNGEHRFMSEIATSDIIAKLYRFWEK